MITINLTNNNFLTTQCHDVYYSVPSVYIVKPENGQGTQN
jgi:hypothetical protein